MYLFRNVTKKLVKNYSLIRKTANSMRNDSEIPKFAKCTLQNHQNVDEYMQICWDCSGAKECTSCKNIWNPLFLLSGTSQNAPSGHDPQNTVSLSENLLFHQRKPSDVCVSSTIQRKSPKIGPRWSGRLPRGTLCCGILSAATVSILRARVSPRLAESRPNVKRK